MANQHDCHMFSGGVLEVEIPMLSTVKWEIGLNESSKMAIGRHCHMFSGGVLEVEIQMLSTEKWQMGVIALCFLEEFQK